LELNKKSMRKLIILHKSVLDITINHIIQHEFEKELDKECFLLSVVAASSSCSSIIQTLRTGCPAILDFTMKNEEYHYSLTFYSENLPQLSNISDVMKQSFSEFCSKGIRIECIQNANDYVKVCCIADLKPNKAFFQIRNILVCYDYIKLVSSFHNHPL
jgi:hypothetical protein